MQRQRGERGGTDDFREFDAVPLIESAGFWAALPTEAPLEPADDLAAAMRQIAQAPQAEVQAESGRNVMFDRAEAELVDLWVRAGDNAYRGVERPALAASASLYGLMAAGDDLDFRAWTKTSVLRANFIEPDPGNYDDANGNGQYDEGEEIIVKGTRPKTVDEDGVPWEPKPGDDTGGGEKQGGSTGGSTTRKVADHAEDCGTADGAAVQIAKKVMGTPPGAGPPNPLTTPGGSDWRLVEFGAVIVRGADGRYGALNDAIYSNEAPDYVVTPISGANIEGLWHNHSRRPGDVQQAIDLYPSSFPDGRSDWTMLQDLKDHVAPNDPSYDPSLWLTGPDGVTREFKLSERAYFEGLTDEQIQAGEGLQGKERSQSCG